MRCRGRAFLRFSLLCCGERGIRTPGGVTLNGFQDRRNRPLCHLSSVVFSRIYGRKGTTTSRPVQILTVKKSVQVDDRDAGSSHLYVLVAEACHALHGAEVLSYHRLEYAFSGAVQNAHTLLLELYCVVDKLGHRLNCLIGPLAAHINVGFKIELSRPNLVAGFFAHGQGCSLVGLAQCTFQP